MGAGEKGLKDTQAKTRVLLALWDMGAVEVEVNQGQLTKRIVTKGKKVGDYLQIFKELETAGAISISKKKFSLTSPIGLEMLGEGLSSGDFQFEGSIVGTWVANALLRWISQMNGGSTLSVLASDGVKLAVISSYEEFKSVALEVYDQLNQNYNLDDLVPIYRIRRTIGERVSRENFNTWLIEMQAEDILQLITGEIADFTPDKREDSISMEGTQLRSYAQRLS